MTIISEANLPTAAGLEHLQIVYCHVHVTFLSHVVMLVALAALCDLCCCSAEPLAQKKPHAPAHRMGHFAVKLPQGATNLHLQLQNHDDFIFGTAYNPETAGSADDLAWYNNITSSMFNGLTPENRFKWFDYEPQPGNYSAARALLDQQYIQFAQQHGFKLARGHTLEWYKTEGFW